MEHDIKHFRVLDKDRIHCEVKESSWIKKC